ncbi:hypothetical protein VKS41_008389 [Umbelopsis sp. WA50703]
MPQLPTASQTHRTITLTQTRHRVKLVHEWQISEPSSVLEVGCGQGDTSVVVADAVGPNGKLTCVDIADEDYGSPLTVGESMKHLKNGEYGERIVYHFNTDVTKPGNPVIETNYDAAILSHCSFYFNTPSELVEMLKVLRRISKKLYFAEHLAYVPESPAQIPHFLALSIHAQIQARVASQKANIRTLFTPDMIKQACQEAGWEIAKEFKVLTPELQDAGWEVSDLLSTKDETLDAYANGDDKWKQLIKAHLEALRECRKRFDRCETLPTWGFIAE